jgi:hypothetical protein
MFGWGRNFCSLPNFSCHIGHPWWAKLTCNFQKCIKIPKREISTQMTWQKIHFTISKLNNSTNRLTWKMGLGISHLGQNSPFTISKLNNSTNWLTWKMGLDTSQLKKTVPLLLEVGLRAQNAIWNFRVSCGHKHFHNNFFFLLPYFHSPVTTSTFTINFFFLATFFSQPLNYCDNH